MFVVVVVVVVAFTYMMVTVMMLLLLLLCIAFVIVDIAFNLAVFHIFYSVAEAPVWPSMFGSGHDGFIEWLGFHAFLEDVLGDDEDENGKSSYV